MARQGAEGSSMTGGSRMTSPQMARIQRILVSEGAGQDPAPAAARVYDKLMAQLVPLLGPVGVRAMLVRSLKLASRELASLGDSGLVESATALGNGLRALGAAQAAEAAAVLFATFYGLITTFIGERLTSEILRNAWPAVEEPAPKETAK